MALSVPRCCVGAAIISFYDADNMQWMEKARSKRCNALRNETHSSHASPLEGGYVGELPPSRPPPTCMAQERRTRNRHSLEYVVAQTSTPSGDDSQVHDSTLSSTESGGTDSADHSDAQSPRYSPPEEALTLWARRTYQHGFEASSGLLLGRYGCPYV